ncbi:hypothetical protein GCM10010978_19310 [Compostibacillus humi]|uniref:Uncharacterized protein n=1 Tax=Compostibacillus humi TaxID=1245525 RepID=A0A8J2XEG8_9BACI|nr:hypothetical protein [Compostibacillus humi]GFZ77863.1 hypothetical protein GCM10010978_19310 [Compostibacillus humi]
MYQYRLYRTEEIQKLKDDLDLYKQTLKSLKSDHVFQIQRELFDLKMSILNIKGEMKMMEDKYLEKISGYEKQADNMSAQLEIIHESLNELKQEVQLIKGNVEQIGFSDLVEKMNMMINKTDESMTKIKNEIASIEGERNIRKDSSSSNSNNMPVPPKQSEFRRLQNLIQSYTVNQSSVQNNLTPNSKTTMKKSLVQSPKNIKSYTDLGGNISVKNGRKLFRDPQYELNKNIITNITTQKKGKLKKTRSSADDPSLSADKHNSKSSENQHPNMPTNTVSKLPADEAETANIPKSTIRNTHSEESAWSQIAPAEKEYVELQNRYETIPKDESNQKAKSFFSFFRKD